MEQFDQPRYDREPIDTGVSPGLLKIFKNLARLSDALFTEPQERERQSEVKHYSYETYVAISHHYQQDSRVKVADILPESDQTVVLQIVDESERRRGEQKLFCISLGSYSADKSRLRIRRVNRWTATHIGGKYETDEPKDVSLVRFFNVTSIEDDIELGAGSRLVRFTPADSTEFYLGDLMELSEDDPVRVAFDAVR